MKKTLITNSLPVRLWRYITKRDRRPRLPRGYILPYRHTDIDEDTRILMQARVAKDINSARHIMAEYGAVTARDVLANMPIPKRRGFGARLLAWARRAEGSYPYDPVASYMVKHLNDDGIYYGKED
jgi:hypothetical protein